MSDADLLRYLHDELSGDERAHIDAQLAAAPAAAERLRVLRQRSTRLSSLLAAVDPTPAQMEMSARALRSVVDPTVRSFVPRSHWWHRTPGMLRAAAAVAVLLGGVLLVEPVRAWVIESARAVAAAVGLSSGQAVEEPAVPQSTGADARFSFAWDEPVLEVDAGAARGTIIVRRGADGRVTAESSDAADAAIVITPRGVRIEGTGRERATYTLAIPAAVLTLRVSRTAGTVDHAVPADGSELRLPLR